jgi:transcriptional regulator with XRE-family HTH domain
MNKNQQLIQLRTRKLGILLYDARTSARRTPQECADAVGIPLEQYLAYEKGEKSPSLPELENLALFLDVSLEHFWGAESLTARRKVENIEQREQFRKIRNRVIGASLRIARTRRNFSTAETSLATSIPEEQLTRYESGEQAVPLPELEVLSTALEAHLEELIDQKGPVGKWRKEKTEIDAFLQLPPELREFLCRPVNQPYLYLAMRLSALSVERLRSIAEALLEITY